MSNDGHEARAEGAQPLLPWGLPLADAREGFLRAAAFWLTGGASLLLVWTMLALLLTA